ncbi:MAG: Spy/CpxP family protein refolding chaperone [Thiotrichales bacterium]
MRKVLIAAIACCFSTGLVHAQAPCHGPRGAEGGPQAEMLKQRLGVDDEQAQEMQAIMEEQRAKHRAMHEKHVQEMEAARAETEARMKSVLSEEQLKRFEAMRERREAMRSGAGPNPMPAPPMRSGAPGPFGESRMAPGMMPPVPGPWLAPRFPQGAGE